MLAFLSHASGGGFALRSAASAGKLGSPLEVASRHGEQSQQSRSR